MAREPGRRGFLGFSLSLLTGAKTALAHGFHAAFTVIEQNASNGSLEIIHRLFTQDLDLALTARTGRERMLDDPAAEALVEEYLGERFALKSGDGRALKIDWVGMTVSVDTVMVYEEVRTPGDLAGLIVANQILAETHPQQVNTVNVTLGDRTKTVIFQADDPPQTIAF
ncbi:MAG: hypothetical protein KDE14_05750 [Rhodobacteraceae bacterium]|nr:hypothetical protein [Paracoccaceae bacterium]